MNLISDRPGIRLLKNSSALNLAADLGSFPHFLGALERHRPFLSFAFGKLQHGAPSTISMLNYMRSVVRRVGMHEMAMEQDRIGAVLADEGTLLIAYLLFVYSMDDFDQADLERFAALVPMPDRVIYVRTPREVLLRRALERPDPRREFSGRDSGAVERWLDRANAVFDGLAATRPIQERMLVVDLPKSPSDDQALLARIGGFIGVEAEGPAATR
jgi:hypothetical protein